jgi:hypothetical protein
MRGRQQGEIIALFSQGLQTGSRVKEWRGVHGWPAALEAALAWLRPGDLALIQADTTDTAVTYMKDYLASHPATREVSLKEALAMAASTAPPPAAAPAVEAAPAVNGESGAQADVTSGVV